jgi:hypothetical protein
VGLRRPIAGFGIVMASAFLLGACAPSRDEPVCSRTDASFLVLEAQAVPSATQLPCLGPLPPGWSYTGFQIRDGDAAFWLDSDLAGVHAVRVDLRASCDVGQAVRVPPAPDELLGRVYQDPRTLRPAFTGVRFLVFDGGCITTRYAFSAGAPTTLVLEAQNALSSVSRSSVVASVRLHHDLTLCGAGAPPCPG